MLLRLKKQKIRFFSDRSSFVLFVSFVVECLDFQPRRTRSARRYSTPKIRDNQQNSLVSSAPPWKAALPGYSTLVLSVEAQRCKRANRKGRTFFGGFWSARQPPESGLVFVKSKPYRPRNSLRRASINGSFCPTEALGGYPWLKVHTIAPPSPFSFTKTAFSEIDWISSYDTQEHSRTKSEFPESFSFCKQKSA